LEARLFTVAWAHPYDTCAFSASCRIELSFLLINSAIIFHDFGDVSLTALASSSGGRSRGDIRGLAYELEGLLGRRVDAVTHHTIRKEVRDRVEREAIPLLETIRSGPNPGKSETIPHGATGRDEGTANSPWACLSPRPFRDSREGGPVPLKPAPYRISRTLRSATAQYFSEMSIPR